MSASLPQNETSRLLALTEQKLVKSQERFRDYVENSLALFCLHDLSGRIISVNRAVIDALGYDEKWMVGRNMAEIIAPEAREGLRDYLDEIAIEEEAHGILHVLTKNGERRIWSYSNVLRSDADGRSYVLGSAQDVTEQKRNEANLKRARDAAIESERVKLAFLTNVSHEIRTPMNAIVGMAELLLHTPLDQEQREYAETIAKSGDALLTVINDILDLSKIEAGKLRFEAADFDIRETVESTVESLAERAYRKQIEIASIVEADVPQIVRGDAGRLRQVLTNLISNAVKYTESGEIGISVALEHRGDDSTALRFSVVDTGIGIAADDIGKLFQPFVQVDDRASGGDRGTGLGLAISKQIVEMMNGQVGVRSEPGRGSEFFFTAAFDKPKNALRAERQVSASLLVGKRILIADSKGIIRQTLKEYIDLWQAEAETATSGENVVGKLRDAVSVGRPFDVAVIDMNLAEPDGFDLARRIGSDPSLSRTRVVLTTAYGQRGDAARAHEMGVAGYLTKPIRGSQLFDCLVTVIGEGASRDAANLTAPPLVTRHTIREARRYPWSASENGPPPRILVAEDTEINRRLIDRQLRQLGLEADMAADGEEALQKLTASQYDVVLMDCQMPRLDGYQTTTALRVHEERQPTARPAVVIALTAQTLAGTREKCLAAGMNDYLAKPVKLRELKQTLEFWAGAGRHETDENLQDESSRETPLAEIGDAAFVREVVDLFVAETSERADEMRKAVGSHDFVSIRNIAHAIRGNALAVGADGLAEIAGELGIAASSGDIDSLSRLVARFLDVLAEVGRSSEPEPLKNWTADPHR